MGRLLIGVEDRKVIIALYSSCSGVHFMELDVGLVRWHCLLALHHSEWDFLIECRLARENIMLSMVMNDPRRLLQIIA